MKKLLLLSMFLGFAFIFYGQTNSGTKNQIQNREQLNVNTENPQTIQKNTNQVRSQAKKKSKNQKKQLFRQQTCNGTAQKQMIKKGKN